LDLVFATSGQLFRDRPASIDHPYENRTITQLATNDAGYASSPITDGTNVVFTRQVSGANIVLLTPTGEEILASWPSFVGPAFQARNGWVAFTKPGTSGQTQIWTRSPNGALQQRTFFGSSSTLESLGPAGEVTFLFSTQRYLGLPGASPWWVNSGQGRVRWHDGQLVVILGRSLFEVRVGQLSCAHLMSEQTMLTFSGPTGIPYSLLGSTDLQNWSELLAFTNMNGTVSWTNSPASPYEFYRTAVKR
jgi:hypothetical protein